MIYPLNSHQTICDIIMYMICYQYYVQNTKLKLTNNGVQATHGFWFTKGLVSPRLVLPRISLCLAHMWISLKIWYVPKSNWLIITVSPTSPGRHRRWNVESGCCATWRFPGYRLPGRHGMTSMKPGGLGFSGYMLRPWYVKLNPYITGVCTIYIYIYIYIYTIPHMYTYVYNWVIKWLAL